MKNSSAKKKRRWMILCLALLALCGLAWSMRDSRLVAYIRFAGEAHEPSVDADFGKLPALLPTPAAKLVTVHRGLPHPFNEKNEFAEHLWANNHNISIHGYRFYREPVEILPEFEASLHEVLSRASSYATYGGPYMCGGYHADFAATFDDGGIRREFLVCFGCHVALIYGGGKELMCDLETPAARQLQRAWVYRRGYDPAKIAAQATRFPLPNSKLAELKLREMGRGMRDQAEWEAERFGKARVRWLTVRSEQEVPGLAGRFHRFTLMEENYSSADEATRRWPGCMIFPND